MTLAFSGKLDGDKLDGNWASDFGEFPVAGKRAGAKSSLVGTWELMVDSPLGNNARQLVIQADGNGSYGGGQLPMFPISDLEMDGQTATMEVTLKSDQGELPCTINLEIDGDNVKGTLDYGDGEADIVGKRATNPIVGTWKLMVASQLGENERELVVKPDMTGTYGGGELPNFPVSNVKVDGDKVTMDVEIDFQGQQFSANVTLKLDGDKVTGNLDYGQGDGSIEGQRQ